jgi:hypothetical protein
MYGCASNSPNPPTAQDEADQIEGLYGPTVAELNDLYEAGVISADTYHNVVTPARKSIRAGLDEAKRAIAGGDVDRAKVLLDGINSSLIELQKYRLSAHPSGAATTQPTSAGPLRAGADPVTAAILVLTVISRLTPIVQKVLKGEQLTDEERATIEKYSADEDARADRLDAQAAAELAAGK